MSKKIAITSPLPSSPKLSELLTDPDNKLTFALHAKEAAGDLFASQEERRKQESWDMIERWYKSSGAAARVEEAKKKAAQANR